MMNDSDAPEPLPGAQPKKDGAPESEAKAGLEAENARLKDQLMRTLADAENMRRRLQRETEDATRFAVSGFAKEMLSVADNLRRAQESVPPELRQDERVEKFAAGVELTERELMAVFERQGVRRIEALGRPFDHNLHQALFEVEAGDRPPGTIVQVLQDGYTLHDRLLRPALVGVAKAGGNPQAPTQRIDTTA